MKTKISLLALLFSMPLFTLVFFSCAKEELVPFATPDKMTASPANEAAAVSESDMTLAEAMERFDFQARPDWRVAIKSFACIRSGETLIVHDPNQADLKFYESRRFSVYWFKDGKPMRSNTVEQDCLCRGDYAAIVLLNTTRQGVGIAFYSVKDCFIQADQSILNDATDL